MKSWCLGICAGWLALAAVRAAELMVVEEHGSRAQRINLVFLAEGYTAAESGKFASDVAAVVTFLFSREPWHQYRNQCNIYQISVASAESGCDNGATGGPGVARDTYFNAGFNNPAIPQFLDIPADGMDQAYQLLNALVPEFDCAIVLVNDAKYGGAGGNVAVVSTHLDGAAVVEHELGHSFALLADEYDENYPEYTPLESPNTTAETDREVIRWRHWLDAATPVPTPETAGYAESVGLFEGSMYRTSGWYRPHLDSVMRHLYQPCGAVNREQFVLQYYARIRPLDGWSPSGLTRTVDGLQDLVFAVTPQPLAGGAVMSVSWQIDGGPEMAAGPELRLLSDVMGNGAHTVTATVHDPTNFVRSDPDGRLTDAVTWTLNQYNQPPGTLADWRTSYGDDLAVGSGDGLPNLVKYALGLAPDLIAPPDKLPAGSLTAGPGGDYLTLTVPRRSRRTDVSYLVEVSGDLVHWASGPGHTETLQDDATALVVRDTVPRGVGVRRFIRLKVLAD